MAIAIRSQSTPTLAASGTSIVINMPAGIQAGDYLVAFIHHQSSASSADLSSSGWTRIGASFVASDSASRITGMYARVATGSETSTYTFGGASSSGRAAGFAVAFTGVDTTTPVAYSSAWYKAATSSGTLSVSAEASTASLYTLEIWASNFATPSSYALTNYDGGLTFIGDGYSPSGAENTSVSRSALRVWGSVAPVGGVPAHTIVTSGTNTQRCAYLVSLNAATGGGGGAPTTTPTVIGHTTAISSGTGSTFTIDPTTNGVGGSVATGDWIIMTLTSSGTSATTKQPTAPAGWTNIIPFAMVGTGSMTFGVWAHQRAGGETTYTWSQSTSETQNTYQRLIFVRNAGDVTLWTIGTAGTRAGSGGTVTTTAPSITTTIAHTLGLLIAGERTTAAETDSQVTCDNFTKQWFENNVDHTLFVATKDVITAGATGTVTVTYPNTQAQNGIAVILGIRGVDSVLTGLPIKVSNGSTLVDARFKLADGAGGFTQPGAYKVLRSGYSSVTQMLAQTTFYCAHRGGSLDYPEMSMYAYGQAALLGYPAMELSLARTSDGVWFGLHDSTLDRTSGVTGVTASSLTWAQVQTYNILGSVASNNPTQPNRPYMRWEEIIALYYPSHVIFVDPKVALSYHTELITMMNALPGTPTNHFVAKYFGEGNSGGWPANARTAGYKTWGYYYAGGAWATWQYLFDILGMDYTAPSGDWTSILSYGKPVMGHITPNLAAVTTALSKGAAGVMVSGVKVNIPPAIM